MEYYVLQYRLKCFSDGIQEKAAGILLGISA